MSEKYQSKTMACELGREPGPIKFPICFQSADGGRGGAKVQRSSEEDRRCKRQKTGAIKPAEKIFPAPEVDLFGQVLGARQSVRQIRRECDRCGAEFDQAPRACRPLRFCSDECRRQQKADHIRRWNQISPNVETSSIKCRQCGQVFVPKPRTRGRAPHWCSFDCRRDARAGRTYHPPRADLFSPEFIERKSP